MPPKEFTNEINEDFYQNLSKRIQGRGNVAVGQARGEALSRGLEGDPFEAQVVGAARSGTANELSDLDANIAYNVAGLGREERLIGEGRKYESEEAQKNRNAQFELARLGREFGADQANTANRRSMQAALWQIPAGLGGAALGGWASGGFK